MTQQTMLERVSSAIAETFVARSLTSNDDFNAVMDDCARAAIEAMREPTPQMLIDAGTMDGYCGDKTHADIEHTTWWSGMIDAALNEELK